MKKNNLVTIIVIIAVLIFALIILMKPAPETSKELAQCLGQNAILYVQLGCHACETQENMFGTNYQYINSIDCFYEECPDISATPTWVINGQRHVGLQSIEKLKQLTGC